MGNCLATNVTKRKTNNFIFQKIEIPLLESHEMKMEECLELKVGKANENVI